MVSLQTWDCALEKSAQTASDKCVFAHTSSNGAYGENIYMTSAKTTSGTFPNFAHLEI